MRLFGWNITKSNKAHDLTDDERGLGLAVRRMNFDQRQKEHEIAMAQKELKLLEIQANIRELKDEIGDGEEDEIESLFKTVILPRFLGGGDSQAVLTPNPPTATILDDATAEEIIKAIPENVLKVARKLPDGTLLDLIQRKTGYDAASAERIVRVFRAKNL